ncbi:MAG TPA: ABC transporter permease [Terriglobia bacterium]
MGLRRAVIASEVALAVVLAVCAGLLIKSLWMLSQVNPGFRPEHILTVRVSPDDSLCRERPACNALYSELPRRVHSTSGVADVAATNAVPLEGYLPFVPAEVEGHPPDVTAHLAPLLWCGAITPGFFRILHIPLLEGRVFSEADTESSPPVIVVSAATAHRFWPNQNPLGKHIRAVWESRWRTVVGVAADVQQYHLAATRRSI